jgi:hypothetical protein
LHGRIDEVPALEVENCQQIPCFILYRVLRQAVSSRYIAIAKTGSDFHETLFKGPRKMMPLAMSTADSTTVLT